jgi:hypothetical protein
VGRLQYPQVPLRGPEGKNVKNIKILCRYDH